MTMNMISVSYYIITMFWETKIYLLEAITLNNDAITTTATTTLAPEDYMAKVANNIFDGHICFLLCYITSFCALCYFYKVDTQLY